MDPAERERLERDWEHWLRALFPRAVSRKDGSPIPFAPHHREFWAWTWSLEAGVRPETSFIGIWGRGGGKSTAVELSCATHAARRTRAYCLYVSRTQDRADDHVSNVADKLESPEFGRYYPDAADRRVGLFGNSKGWRRNRLRTAGGFTIDALGLDKAARGAKVEDARPDLIVLDDVDDQDDRPETTGKKITTITTGILPTGADDVAIVGIQNLIHPDSIFAQLADGRAEFLLDRYVSGPHPALEDFAYEEATHPKTGKRYWHIVSGIPTWEGFGVDRCEALLNKIGPSAFKIECQHDVQAPAGGMFDHLVFRHCRPEDVPDLVRGVVAVDPAVSDTDYSDCHGIHADGLAPDGTIYRMYSWEARTSPQDSLCRAILVALELGFGTIVVETDQGGDTWETTYKAAWRALVDEDEPEGSDATLRGHRAMLRELVGEETVVEDGQELTKLKKVRRPKFVAQKAGSIGPKVHRASMMLAEYETGRFVHVLGTHVVLERALRRFPRTKPLDLTDSAFWAQHELLNGGRLPFGWMVRPTPAEIQEARGEIPSGKEALPDPIFSMNR